jgi:hypothetical protein
MMVYCYVTMVGREREREREEEGKGEVVYLRLCWSLV